MSYAYLIEYLISYLMNQTTAIRPKFGLSQNKLHIFNLGAA